MLKQGGTVLLWRWRRNPLRRRSDVAEAWLGVAAAALLLFAVPALGMVTAAVAEHSALDEARGLHRTTARLVGDAPAPAPVRFSDPAADDRVSTIVRWTTPSGTFRSGTASVAVGSRAGSPTTVWLDDEVRIHPAPSTPAQARSQAAAFGAAAGAGVGVLVLGGWWIARVRLEVRRSARWDRDWAEFDSYRGHRHA
ncbi:Rv1733c family protein [Streptomyces canus]|uniref:Rv1733c family protein n=1 Tax=Streptomyces canus TaxID=58343 RepID=UPI00074A123F|nr:hypothetical protein [Streptomyces canus]KUN13969.1 hypothetical protein AQI96_07285 [Streptomyces canus]